MNAPEPIYFVSDDDVLYRRSDGDPDHSLPDEVLSRHGWRKLPTHNPDSFPGYQETSPTTDTPRDPVLSEDLSEISEERARQIAAEQALPTSGW